MSNNISPSSSDSPRCASQRRVRFLLPEPQFEGPPKIAGDDWHTGILQEPVSIMPDAPPLARIATHHRHVRFENCLPRPPPSPVALAPPVDFMRTIDMRSEGNIAYKVIYDNGLDQEEFDDDDDSQLEDFDKKTVDDLEDGGWEGSSVRPLLRRWIQALKFVLQRIVDFSRICRNV